MDWWDTLRQLQTVFVGFFGFAGVIVTLAVNALIGRRQRREERDHERVMLRAALIEELKVNERSLQGNLASIEERPPDRQQNAAVPTESMDDAYKQFVARIGLLTAAEVQAVMNAYLYLRTYKARLFLLGVAPATGPHHVLIGHDNLQRLKAELEAAIPIVRGAIDELERASRSIHS